MWDAGLWTCALFAASALSLGLAIQVANGALAPEAIGYLSWASAAAVLSLAVPRFRRSATRPLGATAVALGMTAAVAYQAGFLAFTPPGIYLRFSMEDMRLFARGVVAAAVLAAGAVQGRPRTRRWFIGMLLALYGAMGVWIVRSSPSPHIDVFVFQRDACAALLAGKNPYAMTFPNIYGDATPFYGRDLSAAGRLQFGFVYPPLSLFLALPGHLLGDYRYSHVAAIVGAAALMAFARRGPLGAAAAALYLLTPRSFFVIEQGWTEPFVVLLLAAVVFVACRARWALPYALGLFLCVKQYLVVALVPSLLLVPWADRKAARGFVIRVAATALVVTLPLALCNPRAFWADVVMLQTFQPFRVICQRHCRTILH